MLLKKFSKIGFIFHHFVLFLPGKALSSFEVQNFLRVLFFFFFFFKFLSLFLRKKAHRRGRESISSRLHAVSTEPHMGLKLMNYEIMTWAEIKGLLLNQLNHPGAPGSQ